MTAEQSVIARSPFGISDHAMPGAWRVIVARREDGARTWYYHTNDDPRIAASLRRYAEEFAS